MSLVTDLVFITPDVDWDSEGDAPDRCPRFEQLVAKYGYNCTPSEDCGTKFPHTAVYFVGGVNYLSFDLIAEIKAGGWRAGTVLYTHMEGDDAPDITVFGQEPKRLPGEE